MLWYNWLYNGSFVCCCLLLLWLAFLSVSGGGIRGLLYYHTFHVACLLAEVFGGHVDLLLGLPLRWMEDFISTTIRLPSFNQALLFLYMIHLIASNRREDARETSLQEIQYIWSASGLPGKLNPESQADMSLVWGIICYVWEHNGEGIGMEDEDYKRYIGFTEWQREHEEDPKM